VQNISLVGPNCQYAWTQFLAVGGNPDPVAHGILVELDRTIGPLDQPFRLVVRDVWVPLKHAGRVSVARVEGIDAHCHHGLADFGIHVIAVSRRGKTHEPRRHQHCRDQLPLHRRPT
jgi:uncharacterized protein YlxP (DUF503 family)